MILKSLAIGFMLSNRADPDKIPHNAEFLWVFTAHQSSQCITCMWHFIWVCTACHSRGQRTLLGGSSIQNGVIRALNFQQQLSYISSELLCVHVRAVRLQTGLRQWPGSSEPSLVVQLLVPSYSGPTPDNFCIIA